MQSSLFKAMMCLLVAVLISLFSALAYASGSGGLYPNPGGVAGSGANGSGSATTAKLYTQVVPVTFYSSTTLSSPPTCPVNAISQTPVFTNLTAGGPIYDTNLDQVGTSNAGYTCNIIIDYFDTYASAIDYLNKSGLVTAAGNTCPASLFPNENAAGLSCTTAPLSSATGVNATVCLTDFGDSYQINSAFSLQGTSAPGNGYDCMSYMITSIYPTNGAVFYNSNSSNSVIIPRCNTGNVLLMNLGSATSASFQLDYGFQSIYGLSSITPNVSSPSSCKYPSPATWSNLNDNHSATPACSNGLGAIPQVNITANNHTVIHIDSITPYYTAETNLADYNSYYTFYGYYAALLNYVGCNISLQTTPMQ